MHTLCDFERSVGKGARFLQRDASELGHRSRWGRAAASRPACQPASSAGGDGRTFRGGRVRDTSQTSGSRRAYAWARVRASAPPHDPVARTHLLNLPPLGASFSGARGIFGDPHRTGVRCLSASPFGRFGAGCFFRRVQDPWLRPAAQGLGAYPRSSWERPGAAWRRPWVVVLLAVIHGE